MVLIPSTVDEPAIAKNVLTDLIVQQKKAIYFIKPGVAQMNDSHRHVVVGFTCHGGRRNVRARYSRYLPWMSRIR